MVVRRATLLGLALRVPTTPVTMATTMKTVTAIARRRTRVIVDASEMSTQAG
jgi:hypothetical protein